MSQLEAKPVRIDDPGVGKGIILRNFFFKSVPLPFGVKKPSKSEIVSFYKKMIEGMLWSDSLTPIEHKVPRLYMKHELPKGGSLRRKMVEEGADFVIMVLAQTGAAVVDNIFRAT